MSLRSTLLLTLLLFGVLIPFPTGRAFAETDARQPTVWKNGFPNLKTGASDPNAAGVTPSPSGRETGGVSSTPLITVATSLGIVLSLFGGLVWVSRKYGGKGSGGTLPADLVEPLGTLQLDPRTQVRVIRLNRRLVVLAQTSAGLQTISEVTDPEEVEDWLARIGGTAKADFQATLHSFDHEPTPRGFAEPTKAHTPSAKPRDPNATHRGSNTTHRDSNSPHRRRGLFISG